MHAVDTRSSLDAMPITGAKAVKWCNWAVVDGVEFTVNLIYGHEMVRVIYRESSYLEVNVRISSRVSTANGLEISRSYVTTWVENP
jgi:hypothetical protein